MLLNNRPYVPPNCTVEPSGNIEIEGAPFIDSATIKVAPTEDIAQKAYELAGGPDLQSLDPISRALGRTEITSAAESPRVETLRQTFCERIADCHGTIDSECWALGKKAVREVIEQATLD